MSFEKNLTSIIKSSLLGTTPNIDDDFDFKFAFEFSKAHQIIGLAYRGLIKEARFKESSAYKSFEQANYFINYIDIHQKYETDSIFLEFDKNGVIAFHHQIDVHND
jgi:hypothetical protein